MTAGHGGRRSGAGRKKGRRGHQRPAAARWCIYIIQEAESAADVCKIGITKNPLYVRLGGLQTGNWRRLIIVGTIALANQRDAELVETLVQKRLLARKISGEWYRVDLNAALAAIGLAMAETAIKTPESQATLFPDGTP